ncbi:MAG: hypothetical protein KBT11_02130 [Treponema sp.]|nr:hypothetical protein [Candidatus Treponema equifaecale]
MADIKVNQHLDQYVLRGKLRQEGFERWRYVFTAVNADTNQERKFFIELYIVNPGVSPKVAVIGQKSRLAVSESDLQYALAGTAAAQNANEELAVKPSYVLIKAGSYGKAGKHFNKFIASSQFTVIKNAGTFKAGECMFGQNSLSGSISVNSQELRIKPELLCDAGSMEWDVKFERNILSEPMYKKGDSFWAPFGLKTLYSGTVTLNGQEYLITPKTSFGYSDKSWGSGVFNPYFHLSSTKLTSIISGKSMLNSCFAIDGEFENSLKGILFLEGEVFKIGEKKLFRKTSLIHECTQMPGKEGEEKVHWMVSTQNGKYVIDIDVYCNANEMIVRDYEIPQGKRSLMKILGSGSGTGEIRVYKKLGKNLELLEHANIYDAVCEFGEIEVIGK